MVDGTAVLMTMFWAFHHMGFFDMSQRGVNLLDTGAHFYDVYRCADGEYISVGSIEPQFYAELLRLTGLSDDPDVRGADGPAAMAGARRRGSRRSSPVEDPRRVVPDHGGAPTSASPRCCASTRPPSTHTTSSEPRSSSTTA